MQVRQTLYPQGSGEIKLIRVDREIITVITRHDGELVYKRDWNAQPKKFEGKKIIPADRKD